MRYLEGDVDPATGRRGFQEPIVDRIGIALKELSKAPNPAFHLENLTRGALFETFRRFQKNPNVSNLGALVDAARDYLKRAR